MLSCKKATRLVSEGLDRKMPLRRRVGLRFHVHMCRGCSRYARQITALNGLVSNHHVDEPPAEVSENVPRETVQQIKSSLRRAAPTIDDQTEK